MAVVGIEQSIESIKEYESSLIDGRGAHFEPCPFCGRDAQKYIWVHCHMYPMEDGNPDDRELWVACICGAEGAKTRYGFDAAIELWNQRKSPQPNEEDF